MGPKKRLARYLRIVISCLRTTRAVWHRGVKDKVGRPKTTWRRTVEKEKTMAGWKSWEEARAMAKDKDKWRKSSAALCATEREEDRWGEVITKFSIVIGSPRAYLSRNRRAITWVSNYRCPIWTFSNRTPVIGYPCNFHVNYGTFNGFLSNVFYSFQF